MQIDLPEPDGPLLSARTVNGTVYYTLREDVPADAVVLTAAYDKNGRMTAVAAGKDGKAVLPAGSASVRVFLLDRSLRPMCSACIL